MKVHPDFQSDSFFLRALEREDLIHRVNWLNDHKVIDYLLMDYPIGLSMSESWFTKKLADPSCLNLSICNTKTNSVIGMTGLLNINHFHGHSQFYLTIGDENYRGKGLASAIINMVLTYGFKMKNLNKIYLWTIPSNSHARKIYEKNGFKQEGVMRSHYYCNGGYQDLIQHSILKDEFYFR